MDRSQATSKASSPRRLLRSVAVLIAVLVLVLGTVACSEGAGSTADSAAASATSTDPSSAQLAATEDTAAAQTLENATTQIISPAEIVASKVSGSVVNVRVKGVAVSPFLGQEQYEGVGSGIVYTSDGYILTNDHVVSLNGQPADSVEVTFTTGETVPATIVARDESTDLALLKVDKTGLAPVVFVDSSSVVVGQWAIAIGSPLDYRNSVTVGIVSGLNRELDTGDPASPKLTGLLQTDAAISPGNSGGPPIGGLGRGEYGLRHPSRQGGDSSGTTHGEGHYRRFAEIRVGDVGQKPGLLLSRLRDRATQLVEYSRRVCQRFGDLDLLRTGVFTLAALGAGRGPSCVPRHHLNTVAPAFHLERIEQRRVVEAAQYQGNIDTLRARQAVAALRAADRHTRLVCLSYLPDQGQFPGL